MNELYKYEIVTIDSLKEYENNSRNHTKEQIIQLEQSIKEFGFTNPLLVDQNGFIRAGHARFIAGKNLGFTKLPVIKIDKLDEHQLAALVIADNKIALQSSWNMDALNVELDYLSSAGYDLELTGFSLLEIDGFDQYEDHEEISANGDGVSASGVKTNKLSFMGFSVEMTIIEAEFMKSQIESYINTNGSTIGFVSEVLFDVES